MWPNISPWMLRIWREAVFRIGVFPEFAAVVEQHAGEQQVAVEFGINRAQRVGGAHHLGDVLDQAAAAGVVVAFGGGGAAEAVAQLGEEPLAERVQAGVGDGVAESLDFGEIAVLFFAGGGIAGEEVVERVVIGLVEREVVGNRCRIGSASTSPSRRTTAVSARASAC